METIFGSNNWKLTVRRTERGVCILRALTCDARAALPDTLLGEPVVALGARALSSGGAEGGGEELTLRGAPCPAPWDNGALRELTLPPSLEVAGDYALMNCRSLETLRLTDKSVSWGTGALMNCRSLRSVELTRAGGDAGNAVAYFSGELSCELEISILSGGALVSRLVFPEYYEEYEENSPAHHFDYKVYGAGQPYHSAFRSRVLDYGDYDRLFPALLTGEQAGDAALRVAWWRVCCPEGMSAEARARYGDYLAAHAREALALVLGLRDTGMLKTLLGIIDLDLQTLSFAAALSREKGDTAATALLLEEQHRRSGRGKSFEL